MFDAEALRRLLDCYPKNEYGYMTLTRSLTITLHRALWDWLAKNPLSDKDDWPGWKVTEKYFLDVDCDCFACEYTNQKHERSCEYCPLDWNLHTCTSPGIGPSLWTKWVSRNLRSKDPKWAPSISYQIRDLNERR